MIAPVHVVDAVVAVRGFCAMPNSRLAEECYFDCLRNDGNYGHKADVPCDKVVRPIDLSRWACHRTLAKLARHKCRRYAIIDPETSSRWDCIPSICTIRIGRGG